jgi:hypothetical protein
MRSALEFLIIATYSIIINRCHNVILDGVVSFLLNGVGIRGAPHTRLDKSKHTREACVGQFAPGGSNTL